eukprot:TRINITY_DN2496_c0_g1_i1.p3 TRINITY_DN2496_c0_g1~~TRINITY_DN2496_c0_g1_i1.p3  ORF type:complete len:106 (+),score=24.26 TRINITY_DN2496_c0_g1_i1:369-686(+)
MTESTARFATLIPTPVAMPDIIEPINPDIMPPPAAGGAACGADTGGAAAAGAAAGGAAEVVVLDEDGIPCEGGAAAFFAGAELLLPRGMSTMRNGKNRETKTRVA